MDERDATRRGGSFHTHNRAYLCNGFRRTDGAGVNSRFSFYNGGGDCVTSSISARAAIIPGKMFPNGGFSRISFHMKFFSRSH